MTGISSKHILITGALYAKQRSCVRQKEARALLAKQWSCVRQKEAYAL